MRGPDLKHDLANDASSCQNFMCLPCFGQRKLFRYEGTDIYLSKQFEQWGQDLSKLVGPWPHFVLNLLPAVDIE